MPMTRKALFHDASTKVISPEQAVPGAFGLARIGGLTGKLIAAGQAFAGDGSRWTHAFIIVDNDWCIEAEPGGARRTPLGKYLGMQEVAFCDRPVRDTVELRKAALHPSNVDWFEKVLRDVVSDHAIQLRGTPYGYLQYVYMGLVALFDNEKPPEQRGRFMRWLAGRITDRGHMICSQLVDEVYRRAGIKVFEDGRLPQDVTPGDLALRYGIA